MLEDRICDFSSVVNYISHVLWSLQLQSSNRGPGTCWKVDFSKRPLGMQFWEASIFIILLSQICQPRKGPAIQDVVWVFLSHLPFHICLFPTFQKKVVLSHVCSLATGNCLGVSQSPIQWRKISLLMILALIKAPCTCVLCLFQTFTCCCWVQSLALVTGHFGFCGSILISHRCWHGIAGMRKIFLYPLPDVREWNASQGEAQGRKGKRTSPRCFHPRIQAKEQLLPGTWPSSRRGKRLSGSVSFLPKMLLANSMGTEQCLPYFVKRETSCRRSVPELFICVRIQKRGACHRDLC